MALTVCVDVGSTYTKAALIDTEAHRLVGTASHPTTLETDVLDGLDACLRELNAEGAEVLACSSAGGGLRIAVVGNEELVTAEAGRRVALSSGGKVVAVLARPHEPDRLRVLLQQCRPDLVLLTGGTDGGDQVGLLEGASALVGAGWSGPVVVSGNLEARGAVAATLGGVPHVMADNLLPRIGVLAPASARGAVREMFLSHVIGGKGLSAGDRFTRLVRGATPDLVLAGVEVLAGVITGQENGSGPGTGVVVVDVGGATTDVHSVVTLDPEDAELGREVVAVTPVTRTVEGDLGMRWSALSTWERGVEAGLFDPAIIPSDLEAAARLRADEPAYLPRTAADRAAETQLARAAVALAVRRHAGRSRVVMGADGRVVERTGRDLRRVRLVVGSGGVLRHAEAHTAEQILSRAVGVEPEGWQVPDEAVLVVDRDYVLAAIGLLASSDPASATALARSLAS